MEDARTAQTSPRDLLWAHQLKREHGYILSRLSSIESTMSASAVESSSLKEVTEGSRAKVSSIEHGLAMLEASTSRLQSDVDDLHAKMGLGLASHIRPSNGNGLSTDYETSDDPVEGGTDKQGSQRQPGFTNGLLTLAEAAANVRSDERHGANAGVSGSHEAGLPPVQSQVLREEPSLSQATTVPDEEEEEQDEVMQQPSPKKAKRSHKKAIRSRSAKPRVDNRTNEERKRSKIVPPTSRLTRSQAKAASTSTSKDGKTSDDLPTEIDGSSEAKNVEQRPKEATPMQKSLGNTTKANRHGKRKRTAPQLKNSQK